MKRSITQVRRFVLTLLLATVPLLPAIAAELHVPSQYSTIQDAVSAASSGDIIRIGAGDYYEQLLIVDKTNLTLAGEPGAVIHATTAMTQTLFPFGGATTYPLLAMVRSEVVLTGLVFDGERLGDAYPNLLYGIIFRGSSGQITNCTIRGFRGMAQTDTRAVNVVNLVNLGTPVVNVDVINNTFEDNARSVVFAGDQGLNTARVLRATFTIEGNTFAGFGSSSEINNYGVVIFTGAGGTVKTNRMTGYSYRGAATGFSSAVLAYDFLGTATRGYLPLQSVRYERNTLASNDHHLVIMAGNDTQVVSNTFQGTGPGWLRWGGVALSGTNVIVADNEFLDMPIGVELFGGERNGPILRGVATNPKLLNNRFCRVPEPIRAQPLANGIDEQGTQICQDTPPPARTLNVPADYATIQAAVNAAVSGDTVRIAAGEYHEQIVIANKGRLTLTGETGAVIRATASMTDTLRPYNWPDEFPLLGIYRSDVAISGLVLEGGQLGDVYPKLIGMYYLGAGGIVRDCLVRGFRGSGLAASDAIGIYTDNSLKTGSPAFALEVSSSRFEDNQLSIHLRGDPIDNPAMLRMTFTVASNTVTGLGPAPVAMDGIAIRNGVMGEVRGNTIADHAYTGSGNPFSSGIAAHDGRASLRSPPAFVPLFPIRYEGNRFLNNDEHLVIIGGNESQVVNNTFGGTGPSGPRWGGLAISGTNVFISNNDFSEIPTGIVLFGNDAFFSDWPALPPATNPRLEDNWFCNVTELLSIHAGATGVQEQGTQSCPFRPILQCTGKDAAPPASVSLAMRSWHAQPAVIETSTDLQNWTPLYTNTISLPSIEYRDAIASGEARRFYRAVQR